MIARNNRVLLGMSGGTDSSVSAIRLLEAGYEVTGVTFRFYEPEGDTTYLEDARELAQKLGIEHLTYDARTPFREEVIRYFVGEYLAGRTPVPCVQCNNLLKWPLLARLADERGIYHLATGHYVRTVEQNGHTYVAPAADSDKDQSFFLWGLPQPILQRMLLPMGDITKVEARALAADRGFQKVATKRDSLGVCFCSDDYRPFLRSWMASEGVSFDKQIGEGRFVDEEGKVLGTHQGYPCYTVGQRRGLGIHLNRPIFVKELRPATNEVVLSSYAALERTEMWLHSWRAVCPEQLLSADELIVRIRYRNQANRCKVSLAADGHLHVRLLEPLAAIAPGQAAAFYHDGLLWGGGIIAAF